MQNFDIGNIVVYDIYGLCRIVKKEKLTFSKKDIKQEYYVLCPLNSPSSTYYVPVKGKAAEEKLRLPLNETEIKKILSEAVSKDILWIDKRQERSELFTHILSSGISPELVRLIRCIFRKQEHLKEIGKKLSSSDQAVLMQAEKSIREEFAYSLGITQEEVTYYIHSFISEELSQHKKLQGILFILYIV